MPQSNHQAHLWSGELYFKGSACPYRHSEPARSSNETCSTWLSTGTCQDKQCAGRHSFFHTQVKIWGPINLYLKKHRANVLCYWEKNGGCKKPHCPFLHELPRSNCTIKIRYLFYAIVDEVIAKQTESSEKSPASNSPIPSSAVLPVDTRHARLSSSMDITNSHKQASNLALDNTRNHTDFEVKSFDEIIRAKRAKMQERPVELNSMNYENSVMSPGLLKDIKTEDVPSGTNSKDSKSVSLLDDDELDRQLAELDSLL